MAEVEIKALEWEAGWCGSDDETRCYRATNNVGGFYRITEWPDRSGWHYRHGVQPLDEAKAAAQADYEARIRSALVPATPIHNLHDAPVEVNALIERVELVERAQRAIALGEATGARGQRPENIYNIAADLVAAILAERARAEKATTERAEWEHWAATWHRTVETMMTIIGLSSSLGAAEVLSEFRREMDLRGAHKASLREALVEAIGVLERMADRADAIGERGYIADHLRRGANDVRARLSETSP